MADEVYETPPERLHRLAQCLYGESTGSKPDMKQISKWDGRVMAGDIDNLLAEVERLRAALAETEVERDHFHDAITEYNRVIAKIEARYEEQGQYNHQLVRRLADAMGIVRAVVEAGVGDEYGGGTWLMFAGYDAETVRAKARALLAEGEGQ